MSKCQSLLITKALELHLVAILDIIIAQEIANAKKDSMIHHFQSSHIRNSVGGVTLCITLVLTGLKPVQASAASSYLSNPVLAQKVTIHRVPISVMRLCSLLSRFGVQLSASTDYANQQLQIQITDQPINQVMASVATLLTGHWVSDSGRHSYKLLMNSREENERLRWWHLFDKLKSKITAKEYNFALAQFKVHQPTYVTEYVNWKLTHHAPNIYDLSFFSRLPVKIQHQLIRNSVYASYITPPYFGNVSMENNRLIIRYSDLPPADQEIFNSEMKPTMQVGTSLSNISQNPVLNLVSWNGSIDIHDIFKDNGYQPMQYIKQIDTSKDPYHYATYFLNPYSSFVNVSSVPKDVSAICSQLADFPQSVFPVNHSDNSTSSSINIEVPPNRRTDKLEWLAHVAGIQYIADYYDEDAIPLLAPYRVPALQEPLNLEMDAMASRNNCSWQKEKCGIILVSDNTWYRDDKAQPPLSVIKAMWKIVHNAENLESTISTKEQRADIQHKLQIDLECYAYQHLTPLQIIGGLQFYVLEPGDNGYYSPNPKYPLMPFRQIATQLFQDKRTLKFYLSLTPQEKEQLLNTGLDVLNLSDLQKKYAVQCCPSLLYCIDNPKKNLLNFITLLWSKVPIWNTYSPNNDIANTKPSSILNGYTFQCYPTLSPK